MSNRSLLVLLLVLISLNLVLGIANRVHARNHPAEIPIPSLYGSCDSYDCFE